jgi:Tol biopolymer transport system component
MLVEDAWLWSEYVVADNFLYYTKENCLYKADISEKKQEKIFKHRGDMCSPHITNDGRYISFYEISDKTTYYYVIDLNTGCCNEICRKRFEEPLYMANHGMICPTDADVMFFAHEGSTYYVSNRLWIADKSGMRNIARQSLDKDGNLGDCFGHEMWAADGKGLYFVKYPCSPVKPSGICYADRKSGNYDLLFTGFAYWHVGTSHDGKLLCADTYHDLSEIIIINLETKEERCVAKADMNWTHPCHPHPQINPDNTVVCFTMLDKNGRTTVGFENI